MNRSALGFALGIGLVVASVASRQARSDQKAAPAHAARKSAGESSTEPSLPLPDLLLAYFQLAEVDDRAIVLRGIEATSGGDVGVVANALGALDLWQPLRASTGSIRVPGAAGGSTKIEYRLPDSYDARRSYPVVLCLSGETDRSREAATLDKLLGENADGFIRLYANRSLPEGFHQSIEATSLLPRVFRAVRRAVHVDNDRVYVAGLGAGGSGAWMAAINHPDLFAGLLSVDSYPDLPYAQQTYPFMLDNLRDVNVLSFWHAPDGQPANAIRDPVAAHNRAIIKLADEFGWSIEGVEWPRTLGAAKGEDASRAGLPRRDTPRSVALGDGRSDSIAVSPPVALGTLPRDKLAAFFTKGKPHTPHHVSRWFRYPAQGRAGWLRQTRFRGDVWTSDQLAIVAGPTVDRDAYIRQVITGKLAFVSGDVQGQAITIRTKRCQGVDILLSPQLVNLTQSVVVECNGLGRHDGPIKPSIRLLLDTAYDRWVFAPVSRLVAARFSLSIRRDAD